MKIKLTPILFIVLSVLAFLLFMRLWTGAGSFPEIWELEAQIQQQTQSNKAQEQLNAELQADVSELSNSDAAIEDHARGELGMIKKNETYYQVILREDEQPQPLMIKPDNKTAEKHDQ